MTICPTAAIVLTRQSPFSSEAESTDRSVGDERLLILVKLKLPKDQGGRQQFLLAP